MTNMNFPTVETDLVVVGGGPAGFCAAVAAARQGVRVTLVEKNGFAGGMATAGLVGPFMTCYDKSGETMIIRGLFEEVVERLVERGGRNSSGPGEKRQRLHIVDYGWTRPLYAVRCRDTQKTDRRYADRSRCKCPLSC